MLLWFHKQSCGYVQGHYIKITKEQKSQLIQGWRQFLVYDTTAFKNINELWIQPTTKMYLQSTIYLKEVQCNSYAHPELIGMICSQRLNCVLAITLVSMRNWAWERGGSGIDGKEPFPREWRCLQCSLWWRCWLQPRDA